MKIDLLDIMSRAKYAYCARRGIVGMCYCIRYSILYQLFVVQKLDDFNDYLKYIYDFVCIKIHKPPKHYYPLKARHIMPYSEGYWWQLYDVESRLKRFDEYIEYFSKPKNRYLEV